MTQMCISTCFVAHLDIYLFVNFSTLLTIIFFYDFLCLGYPNYSSLYAHHINSHKHSTSISQQSFQNPVIRNTPYRHS